MTDKKAVTRSQGPEVQSVVNLLTDILDEFRKQVQSKTPEPLKGEALEAVERFREIVAALALQPLPTITLIANPAPPGQLPNQGGTATLTWSSTNALTVSIDQNVGEVKPAAGDSIKVFVAVTTTFTATAKGPCGSETALAQVLVDTG